MTKLTEEEVTAKVAKMFAQIPEDEARALARYMPEAIHAFVANIGELLPQAEKDFRPKKLTCHHCGETDHEEFTLFYDDMACRSVAYEPEDAPTCVHALDSTYEHNDGFTGGYNFLHCQACNRETALPRGLDIEFG